LVVLSLVVSVNAVERLVCELTGTMLILIRKMRSSANQ